MCSLKWHTLWSKSCDCYTIRKNQLIQQCRSVQQCIVNAAHHVCLKSELETAGLLFLACICFLLCLAFLLRRLGCNQVTEILTLAALLSQLQA